MIYALASIPKDTLNTALEVGTLTPCHIYIDLPNDFQFNQPIEPVILSKPIVSAIAPRIKEWSLALKPLKLMAKDGDTGLGDIIERLIGKDNSEAFKTWFRKHIGMSCGCNERKEWLNDRFPL